MLTFTVTEESADDPESNRTWTGVSAAGIREKWPLFAALFPDDCEDAAPSLTYTAELIRWRITPEFEEDCVSDGARWADLQSETEAIDGDQVV